MYNIIKSINVNGNVFTVDVKQNGVSKFPLNFTLTTCKQVQLPSTEEYLGKQLFEVAFQDKKGIFGIKVYLGMINNVLIDSFESMNGNIILTNRKKNNFVCIKINNLDMPYISIPFGSIKVTPKSGDVIWYSSLYLLYKKAVEAFLLSWANKSPQSISMDIVCIDA